MGGKGDGPIVRPGVFLDRDGTINVDRGYTHRPEDMAFLPGAVEGLRLLREAGFILTVVTNQSGVARGYYAEEDVRAFHDEMNRRLGEQGVRIDGFYFCPHHPEGVVPRYRIHCECRKPGDALHRRAIADHDIDPGRSFAIGDNVADLEPALALGSAGVLICDPHMPPSLDDPRFRRAASLLNAVRLLLDRS